MTQLIINTSLNEPQKVSYHDGKNIVRDGNGNYYLISQVGLGKAALFEISNNMEWNRMCEPVYVVWTELNTKIIGEIFNLQAPVTLVRAKITIEIE